MNPPNCPELRPIERYWAIIKRNLQKSQKEAKSAETMKIMWKKYEITVTNTTIQNLMRHVKRKVRAFAYGI